MRVARLATLAARCAPAPTFGAEDISISAATAADSSIETATFGAATAEHTATRAPSFQPAASDDQTTPTPGYTAAGFSPAVHVSRVHGAAGRHQEHLRGLQQLWHALVLRD